MGVDEGNYLFCRRSSSAPKKVAAACKMSFARCNSKFSLRSRFSSSRSSVVRPGSSTRVDLGLLHPDAQRLFTHPELSGHPRDDALVARI